MERGRQQRLVRQFFDMRSNRSAPLADDLYRMPANRYVDPCELARERDGLFRSGPVFVGLSGDVRSPGDYVTTEICGLPVVVVRGDDGVVRGLVNACRHRGAPVFESRGHVDRSAVTCPFHAWVYDLRGRLLGQPGSDGGFRGCDRGDLGLRELPTSERHGLLHVTPCDAGTRAVCDAPHDPLHPTAAEDFESLGLATHVHVESRTRRIPLNWKLAMDTFLESYHIRVLHAASVGPYYFSSPSLFEDLGRVAMLAGVRSSISGLERVPAGEWTLLPHATVQYSLPPGGLLVHQIDHVETWTIRPGAVPSESVCTTSAYVPAGSGDAEVERCRRALDRLLAVTDQEDFAQGARVQKAMDGGALTELLFGRNEPALVHHHRVLDSLLGR